MIRNLRNSQYTTQVQKVDTLVGLVPEDGLKIIIDASHSGSVYECKYFIQKLN